MEFASASSLPDPPNFFLLAWWSVCSFFFFKLKIYHTQYWLTKGFLSLLMGIPKATFKTETNSITGWEKS